MPVSYDKLWKVLINNKIEEISDLKGVAGISFSLTN